MLINYKKYIINRIVIANYNNSNVIFLSNIIIII